MDDTRGQSEHIVLLTPATVGNLGNPGSASASTQLPEAMVQAASERGVRLTHVTSQPAAMVQMHRGATGLIVIDPARVPYVRELQAAVNTYYPKVTWRQYKRQRPTDTIARTGTGTTAPESDIADTHQTVKEQTIVAYTQVSETTHNAQRSDDEASPRIKEEIKERIKTTSDGKTECLVTEDELAMLMKPFDDDFDN